MCSKIGKHSTEEVEELIRMLFLDVGKLLGSCIANEWSASFFQKPGYIRRKYIDASRPGMILT